MTTSNGGGVYAGGTSQNTLTDCAFDGCNAQNGGGVFSTNTSQNTLNDCAFTDCSAAFGGGVYAGSNSQNTLTDCAFDGCTATNNGGGVYSTSTAQNTLNGCIIDGCSATSGGGVSSTNTSQNTLNDCIISGCTATSYGGALYLVVNSQTSLSDCKISGCEASGGGAIYLRDVASATVADCEFADCFALYNAGAFMSLTGSRIEIVDSTFTNCTSGSACGAFYVLGVSYVCLSNCNFTDCSSASYGGGSATGAARVVMQNNCVFNNCGGNSNKIAFADRSLFWTDVSDTTFTNCAYYTAQTEAQRTTRYFTNTNDSGDGSLRAVIAASSNNDIIKPDPTIFPKGSTVTIQLSNQLDINRRIFLIGNGRRIVLDGQGATTLIRFSDSYYSIYAEDVDFVNGSNDSSSTGAPFLFHGIGGAIFVRSNIVGNYGTRFAYSSSNGAIIAIASVIVGNFGTTALLGNTTFMTVGSTVAGNYVNGTATPFINTRHVNSITDTTYSTVGFTTPPPDTLAAENWNADLWKSWNLTLRDDSQYKSGAAALDEIDALIVGDDWRYDVEGCPRKPNGAFGAYEDRTDVRLVTTVADSGAGSLRQAVADAVDGDTVLFSYATFPKGETTPIPLDSYIAVSKSISIYGGDWDTEAEGYSSGAEKSYYVYRDIDGVKTKVVISSSDDAQEGETVLFTNVCRVALDGQDAVRCVLSNSDTNAHLLISGLCFKNGNSAGNPAGGFYSMNTSVNTLRDCTITHCRANSNGGGMYSHNDSQNTLYDCSFDNCISGNYGGAIYTNVRSQNIFYGCVFDNCVASNYGGAFYSNSGQNIINDCVISNCNADYGGGVYSNYTSTNTLNDCILDGCTADNSGAAIYSSGSSVVTLSSCHFYYCVATNVAGAILSGVSSQIFLSSCTFTNCSAKSGGAFSAGATTQNTINDCTFTSCSSSNNGGVGYFDSSSQNTVTNSKFNSCSAEGIGGVFYCASASQNTLNNCIITDCSATQMGGALYIYNTSKCTLNGCQITNCSSGDGGGIYTRASSQCDLNNSSVVNCTASNRGPGVYTGDTSTLTINALHADDLRLANAAFLNVAGGVSIVKNGDLNSTTVTIADGAALSITTSSTIVAATFTSSGRGYLAVAAGINVRAATFDGVVLCSYGAGITAFDATEVDGEAFLKTTVENENTPILVEVKNGDAWETVTTEGTTETTAPLPSGIIKLFRVFDGVAFFEDNIGANVISVTGAKFGENYSISINSEDNTYPVVVEYKGESDTEWTVADSSFVGTTFRIKLDGDYEFRIFDGGKYTTATVKSYESYPPMRERVEIGYLRVRSESGYVN